MKNAVIAFMAIVFVLPAEAQHNVSLAWNASPDAASNSSLTYNVYRSNNCAGEFSKRNSAPVSSTNYLDASVSPGSYCYQVTSVLSGNEGSPSNQAAVVVGPSPLAQQFGCPRRGNLVTWLRCVRSVSHGEPKRKNSSP